MRRIRRVMLAVALVLPAGLAASPAGAAADISCASLTGSITFSPPLPKFGSAATVTSSVTGTETFTGCVGLGITTGSATFTGTTPGPYNCDKALGPHGSFGAKGISQVTWNTGQTSTFSPFFPVNSDQVTGGLFDGASVENGVSISPLSPPGVCTSTTLGTATFTGNFPLTVALASGSVGCASPQACNTTRAASATARAPGLTVTISGTPAHGIGTVDLHIASGSLKCPSVASTVAPIADFTDTGFTPSDRLNVTATLPLTSATTPDQVCFHSTVPFKSQSSPTVAKAGTALLLDCPTVKNVAPCVTSSTQIGSDIVVTFVVPGGDPLFYIVAPTKGRQVWLSHFATGKVGVAFVAKLQTSGGIGTIRWSISSGTLPRGCVLNGLTGAITGIPTIRGKFPVVVNATDSERPPRKAKLTVPITIK